MFLNWSPSSPSVTDAFAQGVAPIGRDQANSLMRDIDYDVMRRKVRQAFEPSFQFSFARQVRDGGKIALRPGLTNEATGGSLLGDSYLIPAYYPAGTTHQIWRVNSHDVTSQATEYDVSALANIHEAAACGPGEFVWLDRTQAAAGATCARWYTPSASGSWVVSAGAAYQNVEYSPQYGKYYRTSRTGYTHSLTSGSSQVGFNLEWSNSLAGPWSSMAFTPAGNGRITVDPSNGKLIWADLTTIQVFSGTVWESSTIWPFPVTPKTYNRLLGARIMNQRLYVVLDLTLGSLTGGVTIMRSGVQDYGNVTQHLSYSRANSAATNFDARPTWIQTKYLIGFASRNYTVPTMVYSFDDGATWHLTHFPGATELDCCGSRLFFQEADLSTNVVNVSGVI